MAGRRPPCKLESLNHDVLTAILSTCISTDDLHSCIRGSPILYQVFLIDKPRILCRLNFGILGKSGFRDAVILAHSKEVPYGEYHDTLKDTVQLYRNLHITEDDDGIPLTGELGWDTLIEVTHLAKTASYLTGLYVRMRFGFFRDNFVPAFDSSSKMPWCDWELSTSERQRINTSFVRFQIVTSLTRNPFRTFRAGPGSHARATHPFRFIMHTVFPLYETWEWEQVSQADMFVHSLVLSMARVAWKYFNQMGEAWYYEVHHDGFYRKYYHRLDRIHARLARVEREEPELMEDILDREGQGGNGLELLLIDDDWKKDMGWGHPEWASRCSIDLEAEGGWGSEDIVLMGKVETCVPWAWVDAMDGVNPPGVWGGGLSGCHLIERNVNRCETCQS